MHPFIRVETDGECRHPDLGDQRIGGIVPLLRRTNDRVDLDAQTNISAVGSVVQIGPSHIHPS